MEKSQPTSGRIRTRFIAVLALITSGITFGSALMVFLYMKSPRFEDQLLGQVMKHMDWQDVCDQLYEGWNEYQYKYQEMNAQK